jgi:hypothetical protein
MSWGCLFESKVLRCIFGAKEENDVCQERYNCKLYDTCNELNIVYNVKVKKSA